MQSLIVGSAEEDSRNSEVQRQTAALHDDMSKHKDWRAVLQGAPPTGMAANDEVEVESQEEAKRLQTDIDMGEQLQAQGSSGQEGGADTAQDGSGIATQDEIEAEFAKAAGELHADRLGAQLGQAIDQE